MPNQITARGRLGSDAQVRQTSTGKTVTSFSIACDVGWGDNKVTVWFKCTLWGERGVKLQEFLKKGSDVCVLGEMKMNDYQDKDGNNRSDPEITVADVWLLGNKNNATQAQAAPAKSQPQKPTKGAPPEVTFEDDDIPF